MTRCPGHGRDRLVWGGRRGFERRIPQGDLTLARRVHRLAEKPRGFLRRVEARGIFRFHEVEEKLRASLLLPRSLERRLCRAFGLRLLEVLDERDDGVERQSAQALGAFLDRFRAGLELALAPLVTSSRRRPGRCSDTNRPSRTRTCRDRCPARLRRRSRSQRRFSADRSRNTRYHDRRSCRIRDLETFATNDANDVLRVRNESGGRTRIPMARGLEEPSAWTTETKTTGAFESKRPCRRAGVPAWRRLRPH